MRALGCALLLLTACGDAHADDHVTLTTLAARVHALDCYVADEAQTTIVDGVEEVLRARLGSAVDVAADGRELTRALRAPAFEFDVRPLGVDSAIAMVSFGCHNMFEGDDAWLLSLQRRRDGWQPVARVHLDTPGFHSIVATGVVAPRVALLWEIVGTQYTSATLDIRDANLTIERRIEGRFDAELHRRRNGALIRWSRDPRHLSSGWEHEHVIHDDATVDVDRSGDTAVSLTVGEPWLDALDAACDPHPDASPCFGTIVDDRAIARGREIRIGGGGADQPSDGDDLVVMTPSATGWQVEGIRPVDRLATLSPGDASPLSGQAPSQFVQLPAPAVVEYAAGDFRNGEHVFTAVAVTAAGDELLVATLESEQNGSSGGPILRLAADGTPRETLELRLWPARDLTSFDGTAADLDADGEIAIQRGDDDDEVLTTDEDAHALTACGHELCWSAYTAGQIRRWHRGKVQILARGLHQPLGLAVRGKQLIVATATGLVTVPLTGGRPRPLAHTTATSPIDVAATASTLAWLEADGHLVISTATSTRTIALGGRPTSLALTSTGVFYVDGASGLLRRAPLP